MSSRRRPKHIVDGNNGKIVATRTRRHVRLTVTTTVDNPTGKPITASYAFVDLDDRAVDRLVRRLQAIRGGHLTLRPLPDDSSDL